MLNKNVSTFCFSPLGLIQNLAVISVLTGVGAFSMVENALHQLDSHM